MEHNIDISLKSPFTMTLTGSTQSGKSTLTSKILERRKEIIDPPIDRVMYCYQEYQPKLFDSIKSKVPNVIFHKGLPSEFGDGKPMLLVLDDLMSEIAKSDETVKAFTVYSHHNNVSIIFLTQNFFEKGKIRTITLNSKYIVAMKNPRDTSFINILGRQMNGGKKNSVVEYAFKDVMSKPYAYLVIDLSQTLNDKFRIRDSLFPENCTIYV